MLRPRILLLCAALVACGSQSTDVEAPEQRPPAASQPTDSDPTPPAGDPVSEVPNQPEMSEPDPRWAGPDVDAAFDGPRTLVIRVSAPTGGWKLVHENTDLSTDPARVECKLESPADDELTTQAFVTLEQRVELRSEPAGPVVVALSHWVRGRQYLVAPPYVPVTEVDPPR